MFRLILAGADKGTVVLRFASGFSALDGFRPVCRLVEHGD